jgi:hypothetical protein
MPLYRIEIKKKENLKKLKKKKVSFCRRNKTFQIFSALNRVVKKFRRPHIQTSPTFECKAERDYKRAHI